MNVPHATHLVSSPGLGLRQFPVSILSTCHLLWPHFGLFLSLWDHLTSLGLTFPLCEIGMILGLPPSLQELWEETVRSGSSNESYGS